MTSDNSKPLGLGTLALHAGQKPDPTTGSRAVPIHQTTSYVFKSTEHAANLFALKEMGWIYTRLMNPTTDVFEQRMAALDGGVGALALSSGQQAIAVALFNLVHAGGHIVSAAALYGGTITLLGQTFKRLGIDVTFVDATDPQAASPGPFAPTPGPSTSNRWPIRRTTCSTTAAIADVAHARGLPVVCDNTVLTPMLLSALRPRHRHHRLQRHEVHRRPRHEHRRGDRRQRAVRLDARSRRSGRSSPRPTPPITAPCSTRRWANCATSSPAARTGCATWAGR